MKARSIAESELEQNSPTKDLGDTVCKGRTSQRGI
jgi:hypothetical protein